MIYNGFCCEKFFARNGYLVEIVQQPNGALQKFYSLLQYHTFTLFKTLFFEKDNSIQSINL